MGRNRDRTFREFTFTVDSTASWRQPDLPIKKVSRSGRICVSVQLCHPTKNLRLWSGCCGRCRGIFPWNWAGALVSVQADAETQARYDELAGRRTEGQLSGDEQAELESIVRANTLLGILKAEAHAFLAQTKPT